MKVIFCLLSLIIISFEGSSLFAQNRKLTVILLRHAEKDTSSGASKSDPELMAEGRQRAERLIETVKKYKPDLIYSTRYRRTKATVLPLAETIDASYRIPIRIYNFDKLEEFAEEILQSKARTIVVVGHNTTTPEMANLLIKQKRYKALDDAEYDKIWIVEIRRGKKKPNKTEEKVINY